MLVNFATFLMMLFDKRAGVGGSWRLSERNLLVGARFSEEIYFQCDLR